jgi:hypothetical protein
MNSNRNILPVPTLLGNFDGELCTTTVPADAEEKLLLCLIWFIYRSPHSEWSLSLPITQQDIITPGDGKNFPKPGDKLTMHYVWVECAPIGRNCMHLLRSPLLSRWPQNFLFSFTSLNVRPYSGTLASNGSKFDASRDRGRPFSFTIGVGQVIRGWDEGVMKMSIGEKAVLHITSDYGYGARGAGGVIPPNADLDFEGKYVCNSHKVTHCVTKTCVPLLKIFLAYSLIASSSFCCFRLQ